MCLLAQLARLSGACALSFPRQTGNCRKMEDNGRGFGMKNHMLDICVLGYSMQRAMCACVRVCVRACVRMRVGFSLVCIVLNDKVCTTLIQALSAFVVFLGSGRVALGGNTFLLCSRSAHAGVHSDLQGVWYGVKASGFRRPAAGLGV